MKKDVGIFSFGYWGWGNRVPEMKRLYAKHNNGLRGRGIKWVDVRIRRSVRAKGFNGVTPERLLGKGNYVWIREFGNENILKGKDGVKILDFDGGFERLTKEVGDCRKRNLDLVLFCSCDHNQCHRFTLIKRLKRRRIASARVYGEYPHGENTPYMPG